ncbi:putative leucine-rich repeat receptor-like protein kinase-like [Capsicum annuum]|nr:putative leucine-rich repeat receptor-like protein kinase-like [Capsicum annuum]
MEVSCSWEEEEEEERGMGFVERRLVVVHGRRKKKKEERGCKGCKRLGTVTLISGHGKEFIAEDSKSYLPLMMFDCEGMVPEDYAINGSWKLIIASFIT